MSQSKNAIISAALLIGFFNFLSQIFGLIRDRLLAANVGVGPTLDVYYAAFKIPDTIYFLIFSCVSGLVLIPFFTEKTRQNKNLIDSIYTIIIFFSSFVAAVCFLIYLFLPQIVNVYVPNFSALQKEQMISLVSILLWQPIILSVANVFAFLLQFRNKILNFSLSPVIYNLGSILGAGVFYGVWGIAGLGYGVVLGAILQLLFLLGGVTRLHNFNLHHKFKFIFADVRYLVTHALPRTISLIIGQMRIISFITFGAFLGVGAISAYSLSYAIYFVPINIFVVAYVIAIYPRLCKEGDDNYLRDLHEAYNYLFFITLPIVVTFILLRAHIVRILYGGDGFDWQETTIVAAALGVLALAIPFYAFKLLAQRALFARGIIWTQSLIEIILFGIQVLLIYLFAKNLFLFDSIRDNNFFKLTKISDFNALILPIIFVIVQIFDFIIFYFLHKKITSKRLFDNFAQVICANIIFAFAMYIGLRIFDSILNSDVFANLTFLAVLLHALFSFIFGAVFWYITLRIFNNQELARLQHAITHRFWKKKIDAPHEATEIMHKA